MYSYLDTMDGCTVQNQPGFLESGVDGGDGGGPQMGELLASMVNSLLLLLLLLLPLELGAG